MRKTLVAPVALTLAILLAGALVASPSEGEARKKITDMAQSFLGVPYVYGAESPSAFDCSGFVQYVYGHAAEIDIPRNSKEQWAAGKQVEKEAVKPGDVFVFDTVGGGGPSHVAIFLGGEKMIHAVSEGPKTGVIVSPITDRYFGPRMIGARYFIISAFPGEPPQTAAPQTAAPQAAAPTAPKPTAAQQTAVPAATVPAAPQAAAPAQPTAALKPTAAPAPQTAAPAKPARAAEPPVAQIGFTVTSTPSVVLDKIPAATGTAIAFTITNGTGRDGTFHVLFYKADVDFKKTKILRDARAEIKAGAAREIDAYTFTEPGVYRLNVKTSDNTQLMQRTWKVVEVKR
jgi:cell wall-associated NlpC family hydrolase